MPARFHTVSPSVWGRELRAASRDAQVVALYVLTCKHRVTEGLYELPVGQVAFDTGMSEAEVLVALEELSRVELVDYDQEHELVLDRRALRDNPLRGEDKRLRGAVRRVEPIADSRLKVELYRLALAHSPDFALALGNALPHLTLAADQAKPLASPFEGASAEPSEPDSGKPLASPSQGARRGEPIRGEVETATRPLCGWCSWEPAHLDGEGQILEHDGLPWCGTCEPGHGQEVS